MKLLSNVLIKVTRGGSTDRVLFVDNVPEELFYEMKHPRKAVGDGMKQHWEPDFDKPKEPTLYEELSLSQTGDGGIVFDMEREPSAQRFIKLHQYMRGMWPINQIMPEPVANSEDPTDARAHALPKDRIPRAVLPVLSPPTGAQENPSKVASVAGTEKGGSDLDVAAIKAEAIREYEAKKAEDRKEAMAKVRAAKQEA